MVLVAPERASAAVGLELGVIDDRYAASSTVIPLTAPTLADLNADVIRLTLFWPDVAKRRPLDARDPGDPAYDWDRSDASVVAAQLHGIRVVLTLVGTPGWANTSGDWRYPPRRLADFKDFAVAAARRYSGSFAAEGTEPLPRVDRWTVWNEPNLRFFFRPQWKKIGGRWIAVSARRYAQLCSAAWEGIHQAGAEAGVVETVACGVTAPRGNDTPGLRGTVSPLRFLRAMHRAGAHFDVYAHHPYSARNSPDWVPPDSRWIALGNIGRLTGLVRRLYGPRMRVWLTEFGYRTNPPDNGWSISWAKQAQYLEDAYWIARANPHVDMLVWYQLRDDTAPNGWGSGLLTSTSLKKPAYRTFATLARR